MPAHFTGKYVVGALVRHAGTQTFASLRAVVGMQTHAHAQSYTGTHIHSHTHTHTHTGTHTHTHTPHTTPHHTNKHIHILNSRARITASVHKQPTNQTINQPNN